VNGELENLDAALLEWKELLNSRASEAAFHSFLSAHAGQFLCLSPFQAVVVSKLKLGSSHETDFVIVEDDFSEGIKYTFVEIEVPHAKLFTKGNRPSYRLNTAMAQVNSWIQWLETYKEVARDLLPSFPVRHGAPPKYRFIIVIGRRTPEQGEFPDSKVIDRAWLSKNSGIEVRSFDFLTSLAEMATNEPVGVAPHCTREVEEALARREWSAVSHHEWIKFISSRKFVDYHLHEHSWASLLRLRGMRAKSRKVPNPADRADGYRAIARSRRSSA
jgi:hypothetical protein